MKNIDYIIKKVAFERGISEDVAAKVIKHYWFEAKEKLNSLEHEALFFKHIGTFHIPYPLLRYAITVAIKSYRDNPKDYVLAKIKKLLKIRSQVSYTYYNKWNY